MQLKFSVSFEGKPDKELDVVAYLFDHRGDALASAPLKNGQIQFKVKDGDHAPMRLMLGPPAPEARSKRDKLLSIESLERRRAYEPQWRFDPKKFEYDLAPIPEFHWKWWWLCFCRVRGRVVKPVTIHGTTHDMPVCHARVHICEVDPLWLILPRLPDNVIDRIRDELLELTRPPIRLPIPLPDPPPFRFDPRVRDLSPVNLARLQPGSAVALNPQPLPPKAAAVMLNPQPLPPGAEMDLPAALRANLLSTSSAIVRQALLDNFTLIRPFLCLWPWIWPYFHRCDEVAVIDTDSNGRFDVTIWYPCFGDKPDLYFWVEYSLGGTWTTVYHPPIRCNTYWNYTCGSDVTIRVTDPRVPWCGDPNPLPGKQVAVLLIGNNVSMPEIQRASAGANEGLTTAGQPFGGSLEPHVWFGDGLIASSITHYRWSVRRLTGPNGVTPQVGAWSALDKDVVRHYGEVMADDTLTFKPFQLGPDPAFAGQNLFKIRPVNPPLNPGAVSSSWAPEIDARENTASGFFLSHLLESGDAFAAAGKYELKLELFHADGSPVNLSDDAVLLKVPTGDGPFGPGTVPTELVAHFPAVAGDMEDRVVRDGAGKIVAFRLVLRVDNNPCEASINPVMVNGTAANVCGFVQYHAGDDVHVSYRAFHPNNFATFSFTIARGSAGVVESASGSVGASPVNGYVRDASSTFSKDIPVATLLGACTKAAFAENLHVDALATDGWSTLQYLDDDGTPVAFALEPAP